MLETVKRHLFLVALAGGVVILGAAIFATVYFLYMGPTTETRGDLRSTVSQSQSLLNGTIFSDSLVEQMKEQVAQRKEQYAGLLDYMRELGAKREPLVKDLFPTSTEISLRHSFKSAYTARIQKYMERLNATVPVRPEGARRGDRDTAQAELRQARNEAMEHAMYAHPVNSFFVPEWVGQQEAPSLDMCRYGQEDIWLMDDLVDVLARMNDEILVEKRLAEEKKPPDQRNPIEAVIRHVPVKELKGILIGGKEATLEDEKMQGTAGRYRPPEGGVRSGRIPTLSGRRSEFGFYKVLPWRLTVVVEARYAGELVRRLTGTESLLSVGAYRMTPITEASFDKMGDLMAYSRDDYGKPGVVLLQVVGESLIFQLEGGRITTLDGVPRDLDQQEAEQETTEGSEA